MTMLTVDDLARDLKVRNEDLLKELVTMGFEVEGPESPLETDDPAALRAQLVTVLPQREVVEKRIKPTVIRRRMKKAPAGSERFEASGQPSPRAFVEPPSGTPERRPVAEKMELRSREAAKPSAKKLRRPEPARIIEMAPKSEPAPPPERVLAATDARRCACFCTAVAEPRGSVPSRLPRRASKAVRSRWSRPPTMKPYRPRKLLRLWRGKRCLPGKWPKRFRQRPAPQPLPGNPE